MSARLILFLWCYLAAETAGLTLIFWFWVISGFGRHPRFMRGMFWVQSLWGRSLLGAATLLLRLHFEITGAECLQPGPILVFIRHTSMADTLLPIRFISHPTGLRLRYVLKKELLSDPALAVAGTILPNYFVDRHSPNPAEEIQAVQSLATALTPGDGVLIYPEGTRFTEKKRERALANLREKHPDLVEQAEALTHLLPPRFGGPMALLNGETRADVVFCAHRGFDGFAHAGHLWRGGLHKQTIQIHFWRIPRDEIPDDLRSQRRWLLQEWHKMDAWVDGQPDPPTRASGTLKRS
jgi:1-acyl-sn-glycerol-3-phosphate acyltransferase